MKTPRTDAYLALKADSEKVKRLSLRRLFDDAPKRAEQLSIQLKGIFFDYSKNHLTPETLELFTQFAKACNLPEEIDRLFSGKQVNNTEKRPALHTALRHQGTATTAEQQVVTDTLKKMRLCVEKIHAHEWLGHSKKPIKTVINIGIGGSDLGPRMVTQALSAYQEWQGKVAFVANIDGADLSDVLLNTDPETTLFIAASKSFTTSETLANTLAAREWLTNNGCPESALTNHFIAITSNISAAQAMGISIENIFPMWDWVGGRYSLWSAIGLPIAIAIGMDNFNDLLSGANMMDEHYQNTPIKNNMPAMAGLCEFWYNQFWGAQSHAILAYAQRLNRLPAYLQQLDMESLGKSVSRDGVAINYPTGAIIWGTEGSNGQHSFHQLLHQGKHIIPVDFILINQAMSDLDQHHQYLQACCISQSQALLQGKTLADAVKELEEQGMNQEDVNRLAPHKVVPGNKPSNTIILGQLDPHHLGALLAFYEHKVHTHSVLLDINPFDQWGVELGKQLSTPVFEALDQGKVDETWDSSTKNLIAKLT
jgi:glucose-6-phosphate isomerase